jgi:hypothetical protein
MQKERFKTMIRSALPGVTDWGSPDLGEMAGRMVECRRLGFTGK